MTHLKITHLISRNKVPRDYKIYIYFYIKIKLDRRIILRCIFTKWNVRAWTVSSWFRIGTGSGHV
jgi:adenine-specific DNA methylase